MLARLYYATSGRGLAKDAELLAQVLAAGGFEVEVCPLAARPVRSDSLYERSSRALHRLRLYTLERLLTRLEQRFIRQQPLPPADINIHLERIFRDRFASARRNIFIPNQEWFRPELRRVLCLFDHVACKTTLATQLFSSLCGQQPAVSQIGFSCNPPATSSGQPHSDCLHIAGKSPLKGSLALLEAWAKHPEWPLLHVISDSLNTPAADNIRYYAMLDEAELALLRGRCRMAIQPSEAEGYGHVLAEAMALGCAVITTDAPPMNELIQPDRGFLVPWHTCHRHHSGHRYPVTPQALEQVISEVLSLPEQDVAQRGANAQAWYLAERQRFAHRLCQLLRHCAGQGPYSAQP